MNTGSEQGGNRNAVVLSIFVCLVMALVPSVLFLKSGSCSGSPKAMMLIGASIGLASAVRNFGDFLRDCKFYANHEDLDFDNELPTMMTTWGKRSGRLRLFFLQPVTFFATTLMITLPIIDWLNC